MQRRSPEQVYEELLVLRAQDGDEASLAALLSIWRPRLYAQAVHLLGEADAAEDATQEACAAAMKALSRLNDPAAFPRWVCRILNNKAADHIRRAQRRRAASEELAAEGEAVVLPTLPADSEDDVTRLRAAMRRLPGDRRAILTMFYLRSLSIREIAGALGVPEGTVKSRLFHARDHLKKIMNRDATSATTSREATPESQLEESP